MPTLTIYFLTKKRWSEIKKLKENQWIKERNEDEVADGEKIEILIKGNNKDKFVIPVKDFLYAESQRNYVVISYIKNNDCKSKILRMTLTQLEETLKEYPQISRCHRSFIVNLSCVANIEGNSRNCFLRFRHVDVKIPVSQSYIDDIRKILDM